jgi:hypothetical protein
MQIEERFWYSSSEFTVAATCQQNHLIRLPVNCQSRRSGYAGACVKTLTKIFGQKIGRLKRHTSDDRHLRNGFGTPNFSASLIDFEFLHTLAAQELTTAKFHFYSLNDCNGEFHPTNVRNAAPKLNVGTWSTQTSSCRK